MRAHLILADAAQVDASNKLHLLGAGWMFTNAVPMPFAVVAMIWVPWHDANRKFAVKLRLLDGNGRPIMIPGTELDAMRVVGFENTYEVGPLPGTKRGSELLLPIIAGFAGLRLAPDQTYEFRLSIDDKENADWRVSFSTRPEVAGR